MYRQFRSQEEIDREYNPRLGVPDVDGLMKGWAERSAAARERLAARLDQAFGPTLAEWVDVFPAARPGAPIHIFLHGGYWRAFGARDFSFIAEAPVARGHAAVIVNYALCPQVSISEIVRQARAALAWTWRHAEEFGGDRQRITVSGHSAGGHLVARLLATEWRRDYGLPDDVIKGALAISGLFDLEPIRWSWLQPTLQLSGDEILAQSPIRHPHRLPTRLAVAVGAKESGEFRRQSRDYANALMVSGLPAHHMEVEGRDHFTILDDLADPQGVLWSEVESFLGR